MWRWGRERAAEARRQPAGAGAGDRGVGVDGGSMRKRHERGRETHHLDLVGARRHAQSVSFSLACVPWARRIGTSTCTGLFIAVLLPGPEPTQALTHRHRLNGHQKNSFFYFTSPRHQPSPCFKPPCCPSESSVGCWPWCWSRAARPSRPSKPTARTYSSRRKLVKVVPVRGPRPRAPPPRSALWFNRHPTLWCRTHARKLALVCGRTARPWRPTPRAAHAPPPHRTTALVRAPPTLRPAPRPLACERAGQTAEA